MTLDLAAQQGAALDLIERGLFVFDLDHPASPECLGRHAPDRPCDGERGKHPVPWSWPKGSTDVVASAARMFGRGPRNLAVDCGRSGLVVLDEDAEGALEQACARLELDLPTTLTVSTGKGRHLYYRQPDELPWTNRKGMLAGFAVDVRGRGGYVVAPGSLHATGRSYAVAVDAPIAEASASLARVLGPPARRSRPRASGPVTKQGLAGILRVVVQARKGNRNSALHWSACRLFERVRDGRLNDHAAEAMLLDAARLTGLGDGESHATVGSARKKVLGTDE